MHPDDRETIVDLKHLQDALTRGNLENTPFYEYYKNNSGRYLILNLDDGIRVKRTTDWVLFGIDLENFSFEFFYIKSPKNCSKTEYEQKLESKLGKLISKLESKSI